MTTVELVSRAYLEGLLGLEGDRLDSFLQEDATRVELLRRHQRMDGPKRCVKGFSCGNTCIPQGRQCRVKASPQGTAKIRQLLALPAAGQSSSQGPGGARSKDQAPSQRPARVFPQADEPGSLDKWLEKRMEQEAAVQAEIQARKQQPVAAATTTEAPAKATNAPAGPRAKPESIAQLRQPVLDYFGVKTIKELQADKNFKMATAGDEVDVTSREGWARLHRQFIGVPKSERNQPDGPTVINGIDVLQNFRPWHVFGLDPKKATPDDVNKAFRRLAKQHHPDVGGDRRTFERLQSMRDSVLYFMK